MEPEARYTVVGVAVLVLLGLLAVGLIWLSSSGGRSNHYAIQFKEQSLEGLQLGSDVNMRGVKVGRVQSYELSPDNINQVDVTIEVSRDAPVSQNTTAVISRSLLTGLARIDLVTPGTPGPVLVAVLPGEEYPLIPEGSSSLNQIADTLGSLAATGQSALGGLDSLLDSANRETIMSTVVAARDLIQGLEQRLGRLDQATDSVEQTAAAFRDAALAFQGTARALEQSGRVVTQAVDRASAQIDPLSKEARAALGQLTSAARSLERQSGTLIERFGNAVDAGGIDLRVTARELRGSAESLARAAERLRDPAAAILGPSPAQLGPGEGRSANGSSMRAPVPVPERAPGRAGMAAQGERQ